MPHLSVLPNFSVDDPRTQLCCGNIYDFAELLFQIPIYLLDEEDYLDIYLPLMRLQSRLFQKIAHLQLQVIHQQYTTEKENKSQIELGHANLVQTDSNMCF